MSGSTKKWCHIHNIKHGDSYFPKDQLCSNEIFSPKGLYQHFKTKGETCQYHSFLHQYMLYFYSNWYKVPNQNENIGDPHAEISGSESTSITRKC